MKAALLAALALALPSGLLADGPCLTPRDLARCDSHQLDALFAAGTVGEPPVGRARGRVLLRLNGKFPRTRARLEGLAWKGKVFYPDGTAINQWACLRAVWSRAEVGPSWRDGQPCLVVTYAPDAAVFGNTRDELREVAPGLWLGRFYSVCPCGILEGYFSLEMTCER